jgi:hypothetical protein
VQVLARAALPHHVFLAAIDTSSPVVVRRLPVKRVLDISNNSFSGGTFPLWLLEALPRETADCNGCDITVKGGRLLWGGAIWGGYSGLSCLIALVVAGSGCDGCVSG